jgi:DNA polymerase-3 subunit gamma/tau
MARALYRKYRSKSLDEIIGQAHITDILSRAVSTGRISHAYLLTGPKGVGKTSVARILAHAINNLPYSDDETHLDIIEIDAASNNGVEDVRDLREKVQIAPVSASKKVYIIDEVHMLSKAAFNALLKTLEEPPEHVVFILATTDVEKLPATIVSRTQRFSFRAIGPEDAVKHLRHIADTEKIKVDDASLALIAERGDGSFRDSISLLDQLSSLTDNKTGITAELIEASLGLAPAALINDLIEAIETHELSKIVSLLDGATNQGISPMTLSGQLTNHIRTIIADKPHLLPLLDTLLDVTKNSQPELKLLSVLGTAALPKQPTKSVGLIAPVLEVSASIDELTKQATKAKPKEPANKDLNLPTIALEEMPVASIEEDVPSTASQAPQADDISSPVERPLKEKATGICEQNAKDFNWDSLIEYTRKNHVALYSVLSKCHYELDKNDLTLYTQNKFYKKKLDDIKYSAMIHSSLQALGSYQLTIHTIPTPPTPKDSQAAAVAAIMGGGEEVSVEAS